MFIHIHDACTGGLLEGNDLPQVQRETADLIAFDEIVPADIRFAHRRHWQFVGPVP